VPYKLTTALQTEAPGQTLAAQLMDETGAEVGPAVTSGFVDLGEGYYSWTYASFPSGFRGVVVFSQSGVLKTVVAINPEEGEQVGSIAGRLVSGPVEVISPVAENLAVRVVRGDDYADEDGRALTWTNPDGSWPDLTGATITLGARIGGTVLELAGDVVTATGPGQQVRVAIAAADTASLQPGGYTYDVQATLDSGRKVTLVSGPFLLQPDIAS
jgi:hypothetical protein